MRAKIRHTQFGPTLTGIWLFYLVLAVVVTLVVHQPIRQGSDQAYFLSIAESVVAGRGFVEGFLYAYRPPGYPVLLSVIMWLGASSIASIKIWIAVVMSTTIPLAGLLCRRLFGTRAGLLGAASAACLPSFIQLPDTLFSENLFFPLFFLLFLQLHRAFTNPTISTFGVAGAICGATTLTREVTLYVPILIGLTLSVYWFGLNGKRAHLLGCVGAFILTEILVLVPWMVRNYLVFGQFVPISTNPWVNIYIGNNPRFDSTYSFTWALPEGVRWNWRFQAHGEDELAAVRAAKQAALEYIRANPGAFLRRVFEKMIVFVTPHFHLLDRYGKGLTKVLACVDLVMYTSFCLGFFVTVFSKLRRSLLSPFLLFVVLYCTYTVAVAGLTYSNSRYRLPLTILVLVCSSGFWANALSYACGKRRVKALSTDT